MLNQIPNVKQYLYDAALLAGFIGSQVTFEDLMQKGTLTLIFVTAGVRFLKEVGVFSKKKKR